MTIAECGERWQILQKGLKEKLSVREIAEKLHIGRSAMDSWVKKNGNLMVEMYGFLPFTPKTPKIYLKFTEVYRRV